MTMTKLAELAGVSVSTVSKAFSGSLEISQKQREHIFDTAKAHGCYDKYCKAAYDGTVIGVICPEFKSKHYGELLSLLDCEIKKYGGIMVTGCTDFNPRREDEIMTLLTEYIKVDGIISLCNLSVEKRFSTPIVVTGDNKNYNSVVVSEDDAVNEAIQYLKRNGHRRIAYIGESHTSKRLNMFERAMTDNGLAVIPEYVIEDSNRFEVAGYNGMNTLLDLECRPTAVIAAYDNIAIGAMKSIYEHNLKIPDDISVVGFDDINELPYLNVPLTSITSYNNDLCEIMTELLYNRIQKDKSGIGKRIKVSKSLIKRESVGSAPL